MERFPSAAGQMLAALDFHLGPTPEIVIPNRLRLFCAAIAGSSPVTTMFIESPAEAECVAS